MKRILALLLAFSVNAFSQTTWPAPGGGNYPINAAPVALDYFLIHNGALNKTQQASLGVLDARFQTAGDARWQAIGSYQPAGNYLPYRGDIAYLPAMRLTSNVATIVGASSGVSGATFNAGTGTVFAARNVSAAAGTIYELTQDGIVVRTITNSNFIDTEEAEWVAFDPATNADVFIVAEEDHTTTANEAQLTLCRLTRAATTLDRTAAGNVTVTTAYSGGNIANLGLEALAYDWKRQLIYYTIEKQTAAGSDNTTGTGNAKIFQRSVTSTGTLAFGAESVLCNINALFSGTLTDISDMAYDGLTDTILILSDESDKVVRINRTTGAVIEQLSTPLGQPEGLAIHPDGKAIYVIGEAQEFQRYEVGSHYQASSVYLGSLASVPSALTGVVTKVSSLASVASTSSGISNVISDETGSGALVFATSPTLTGPTLNGDVKMEKTIQPAGNTGAQTINKSSGAVNFAATATSLVVTNSLCTVNSIITISKGTNETTARLGGVVAAAGSFTIYMDVAPAAECKVFFRLTN